MVGGGVLLATVAPAFAHANFGTLASVPTNTDQTLTMEVPLEKGDEVHNAEVRIAIPSGWTALSCPAAPDWSCSIEQGSPVSFRFTSQSPSSARENFAFAVHSTDQLGTYKFPTIQKYTDGSQSDWIGKEGDPNPAPVLKTTQGPPITVAPTTNPDKPTTTPPTTKPATPTTQTPVTNPGGGPVPTTKPGVTTTAIPGAPTSTTTSTTADPSGTTSVPEDTTTTTSSTVVAVTGTGTVPGTAPAVTGTGTIDAAGRPAASPSGGNGPLLGAIGVVVLAGLAGVLVFRKNIFGGGDAAAAGAASQITPISPDADPTGPTDAAGPTGPSDPTGPTAPPEGP